MTEAKGHNENVRSALDAVQDIVYRFCRMQLGCDDKAREATQETALRMVQHQDRFEGNSKMTTWAIGIAINVCRESRRKRTDRALIESPDLASPDETAERLEKNEQLQVLQLAMSQLTDRQREIVTLRYLEEFSVRETAELMQVAEGTVKATTSQALSLLRNILGHNE